MWPNGKRIKRGRERARAWTARQRVKSGERVEKRIDRLGVKAERRERKSAAKQRIYTAEAAEAKARASRPPTTGERVAKGILGAAKQAQKQANKPRKQPRRRTSTRTQPRYQEPDIFGMGPSAGNLEDMLIGPAPRRGKRGGGNGGSKGGILDLLTR